MFLVVQSILFHGSAYLNRPEDERWLRRTLRTPSFYLTEGAVLLVGGRSAALWTGGAWFLLLPIYGSPSAPRCTSPPESVPSPMTRPVSCAMSPGDCAPP